MFKQSQVPSLQDKLSSPDWAVRLGAISAVVLSTSLGLCGVNAVLTLVTYTERGPALALLVIGYIEIAGVCFGILGLAVSAVTLACRWCLRSLRGTNNHKDEQ